MQFQASQQMFNPQSAAGTRSNIQAPLAETAATGIFLNEQEFLECLFKEMMRELRSRNINLPTIGESKEVLCSIFPTLQSKFFTTLLTCGYSFGETLVISLFAFNNFMAQIGNCLNDRCRTIQPDSLFLKNKRGAAKRINIFDTNFEGYSEPIKEARETFVAYIRNNQQNFDGLKIKMDAFNKPETFSCGICYDDLPRNVQVDCLNDDSNIESHHSFCQTCVKSYAESATTEAAIIVESGNGLKCPEQDCKNVIRFSAIKKIIPKQIRQKLDERMTEENLGKAGLNLDRCRNCNFAVEMIESKELNQIFHCHNCKKNWCRICQREYDEGHINISCEDLDNRNKDEKMRREVENQLNKVAIRQCHNCNVQFTKDDGCNKMKCRCGATQCYICRAENIDYNHFCQHELNPNNRKCDQCDKKCVLFADVSMIDYQTMKKITDEAAKQDITLNPAIVPKKPQTMPAPERGRRGPLEFEGQQFCELQ